MATQVANKNEKKFSTTWRTSTTSTNVSKRSNSADRRPTTKTELSVHTGNYRSKSVPRFSEKYDGRRKSSISQRINEFYVSDPASVYSMYKYHDRHYSFTYTDLDAHALYNAQKTTYEFLRRIFKMHREDTETFIFSPLPAYFLINLLGAGARNQTQEKIWTNIFFNDASTPYSCESSTQLLKMFANDEELEMDSLIGVFADGKQTLVNEDFERNLWYHFGGELDYMDAKAKSTANTTNKEASAENSAQKKGVTLNVKENDRHGDSMDVSRTVVKSSATNFDEDEDKSAGDISRDLGDMNDRINQWIDDISSGSATGLHARLPKNTKLSMVQLSFLKSFWNNEFPSCNTVVDVFFGLGDQEVPMEFSSSQETLRYVDCKEEGFRVAFFPFESAVYGNEWELAIFLPKGDLSVLKNMCHFMKCKQIRRMKNRSVNTALDTRIPVFSVEKDVDMKKLVETFGVRFENDEKNMADFSGISKNNSRIDVLIQKSSLSLGEEGVAGANDLPTSQPILSATASKLYQGYKEEGDNESQSTEFHVIKPFAFCIFQYHAGLVLSAGVIYDPLEEAKRHPDVYEEDLVYASEMYSQQQRESQTIKRRSTS